MIMILVHICFVISIGKVPVDHHDDNGDSGRGLGDDDDEEMDQLVETTLKVRTKKTKCSQCRERTVKVSSVSTLAAHTTLLSLITLT